jgi:IS5 family transposase
LVKLIPWDGFCNIYLKFFPEQITGRPGLSPRVFLGATIIKHLFDIDDRETVNQISESIYMQHFLGYSSFSDEPPFDRSLFVSFRKHLSMDVVRKITEKINVIKTKFEEDKSSSKDNCDSSYGNENLNKGAAKMDVSQNV